MGLKFLRRDSSRHPKLGKRRKKKLKWRRPRGRDNKMREKRGGYPKIVGIGYKKDKKLRKNAVIVKNVFDLEKIKEDNVIIIGKTGNRKKIEIAKKARELKMKFANLNIKKFLKKIEKKGEPEKNVKTENKEIKNEFK